MHPSSFSLSCFLAGNVLHKDSEKPKRGLRGITIPDAFTHLQERFSPLKLNWTTHPCDRRFQFRRYCLYQRKEKEWVTLCQVVTVRVYPYSHTTSYPNDERSGCLLLCLPHLPSSLTTQLQLVTAPSQHSSLEPHKSTLKFSFAACLNRLSFNKN